MKLFLLPYVKQLTERYHSDGGLVLVAKDEQGVRDLIAADKDIKLTDEEWAAVRVFPLVGDHEPEMWVFPDAGCC